MRILGEFGRDEVAKVYLGDLRNDNKHVVEFVESLQPPIPRSEKWVLIVSSSFGCPMRCMMCDAGGRYFGRLETDEILAQVDHMVLKRFPDRKIPARKFKVQFARMGEPSLNPNVIDALGMLHTAYDAPGLIPCVSTIAPKGSDRFFESLRDVKNEHYTGGRFQIQFSVHTTDQERRDWLIPGEKWGLADISRFGEKFFETGDRKIALNFAMTRGLPIVPLEIADGFDPEKFLIKMTPLNPTSSTRRNNLSSALDPLDLGSVSEVKGGFERLGFEVIVSVGELEENKIGSNCGQFVSALNGRELMIKDDYETSKYRLT